MDDMRKDFLEEELELDDKPQEPGLVPDEEGKLDEGELDLELEDSSTGEEAGGSDGKKAGIVGFLTGLFAFSFLKKRKKKSPEEITEPSPAEQAEQEEQPTPPKPDSGIFSYIPGGKKTVIAFVVLLVIFFVLPSPKKKKKTQTLRRKTAKNRLLRMNNRMNNRQLPLNRVRAGRMKNAKELLLAKPSLLPPPLSPPSQTKKATQVPFEGAVRASSLPPAPPTASPTVEKAKKETPRPKPALEAELWVRAEFKGGPVVKGNGQEVKITEGTKVGMAGTVCRVKELHNTGFTCEIEWPAVLKGRRLNVFFNYFE